MCRTKPGGGCRRGLGAIAAAHPLGAAAVFTGERGSAVSAMAEALNAFLLQRKDLAGVIGAGGSGATALVGPAMRALPVGLPKLLVSTLASGDVRRYVGSSDIVMLYPVVDVSGLNRFRARCSPTPPTRWWHGAGRQPPAADTRPAIGLTMFGVTTTCVQGREPHWKGSTNASSSTPPARAGRAIEKLADHGHLAGGGRPHDDRDRRPAGRRRSLGRRGAARRADPGPCPTSPLRRARHGELLGARHRAAAVSRPPLFVHNANA